MNCPVLNSFAECCCFGKVICTFCLQLTIAALAIIFGALVAWKPKKTIDIQIALYRPFNWKIEPISMGKEIKNTRLMGLTVLILGIFSLIYIVFLQ